MTTMETRDWKKETVPAMLAAAASRWAERSAVITAEGEKTTFRELYDQVCRLAIGFYSLGIKKGDHIATLMGGQTNYIVASYALMMIGAVVVPINYNLVAEEMASLIEQSDSRCLVMEEEINGVNYLRRMEQVSPEIVQQQDPLRLRLKKLPKLENIIGVRFGERVPAILDYKSILERGGQGEFSLVKKFLSERRSDDPAFIIYTSGTTAFPKGAVRTQGSALGIGYHITVLPFRLNERDIMLGSTPFFHIGGCVYNTLGPHLCGCAVVLMKSFDAGKALELIERHRITLVGGFETHFHRLLTHPEFRPERVSSVTKVRLATGPFWYDKVREMGMGSEIIAHHYGFTEGTGVVMPVEERDYEIRKNSNGKPFPGVELKIVDPETGNRQTLGVPGEICLKGWTLFSGYYRRPEETASSIDAEGFFHTGDYGWIDSRGYLYFRGRYKQMVKTGGENVSQREVEVFLEGHPEIQGVQVIGLPDPEWGEAVTAVVQSRSGKPLSLKDVKDFCKGQLAGFKIPKLVVNIERGEWPVTRVGKIDKIRLREWAMKQLGMEVNGIQSMSKQNRG